MNHQNESVDLSQVVDSEAFIFESVRIFFDPLGEDLADAGGLEAFLP